MMRMATDTDFAHAMRAFDLFTLEERKQALEAFARLRYPSITDRFFEAVYRVVNRDRPARAAGREPGEEG